MKQKDSLSESPKAKSYIAKLGGLHWKRARSAVDNYQPKYLVVAVSTNIGLIEDYKLAFLYILHQVALYQLTFTIKVLFLVTNLQVLHLRL